MLPKKIIKKRRTGEKAYRKNTRYTPKEYVNPFFQDKKKKSRGVNYFKLLSIRTKIIMLVLSSLFLIILLIGIYGPYLKIENIVIQGEGHIENYEIEKIVTDSINKGYFIFYPRDNIILLRVNKIKAELNKKYAFNFLEINKKLPKTLLVNYKEKDYSAIYFEDDQYYYIDSSGYLVSDANPLEISERNYPIIKNEGLARITDKQAPVKGASILKILYIFKTFKNFDKDGLKPESFIINNEQNSVRLKLSEGPYIIFDVQNNIDDQIEKMNIIKTEKLETTFFDKEYIDLRYGSSVYYR